MLQYKTPVLFLWVVVPCGLVGRNFHFGEISSPSAGGGEHWKVYKFIVYIDCGLSQGGIGNWPVGVEE